METTRIVHTVLAQVANSDQPVFTDPRTMMVLYQMNGFKPYPGGLYRYVQQVSPLAGGWWDKPFEHVFNSQYGVASDGLDLASRSAGWVVYNERLAKFCEGRRVPIPAVVKSPPPNWVKVGSWGSKWPVSLYLIQPVVRAMRPIPLSAPAEQYRTPLETGVERNSLALSAGELSAAMVFGAGAPGPVAQWAGVRLPVKSSAFRLRLSFRNVGSISAVSVYSGSAKGTITAWRAYGADLPADGKAEWYEFRPGAHPEPFALTRNDSDSGVEFVDVMVEPNAPGAQAGLGVEGIESQ
jgi:hypothetical protein